MSADRSASESYASVVPTHSQWLAFLVASVLFVQVPGPSLLFTIGRALSVGRRDALLSVVGNALGLLVQVVVVAVGLGSVLAASATAFSILKLAGAAYVLWLGVQAIRHRRDARAALETDQSEVMAAREPALRSLRTGIVVGSTNPKTVVFFGAFLPQFVDAHGGHGALHLMVLGLVFAVLAVASDSMWALAAGRAKSWFARKPRRLDALGLAGGVMMLGLGAYLAASE